MSRNRNVDALKYHENKAVSMTMTTLSHCFHVENNITIQIKLAETLTEKMSIQNIKLI